MSDSASNKSSRNALGRGLAALIPTAPTGAAAPTPAGGATEPEAGPRTLPIERVQPNKAQPRKSFNKEALDELAASIKEQGILQPIVVHKSADGYEIVAGERRWRAAALAGLSHVPVVIKDLSEADVLKIALIENIQREDLDPLEEAQAYAGLIREFELTQEQVAKSVGKNRATVANALRLLKLPESAMELLADGKISAGHARAIMTLGDDASMERLAKEIAQAGLSVRDAEARARKMKAAEKKKAAAAEPSHAARAVEERLMRRFGTKIRLVERRGKGRIEIAFHTLEQLDDLLSRLDP